MPTTRVTMNPAVRTKVTLSAFKVEVNKVLFF